MKENDRDLLETDVGCMWLWEVERYYQKYLPSYMAKLKSQGKWENRLESEAKLWAQTQLDMERGLNREKEIVEEKDPEKKQKLMNMNRMIAEEETRRMFLMSMEELKEEERRLNGEEEEEKVPPEIIKLMEFQKEIAEIRRQIAELIVKK